MSGAMVRAILDGRKLDGWELYLDGVLLQDKLSTDICAYARIGLIAELKEAKHDT